MELIAFASGKGGTGKTLMASYLGYALIKSGHRVLMIDADPATYGLSLFLLGKEGMRQVRGFKDINTFTGALRQFQKSGEMECEPRGIHRAGSNEQGDHGVSYQAIISDKWIYGDDPASSDWLVVPDLDQATFRKAVTQLFASIKAGDQYDYVIVDTRGGFAFESTDVCALADSFIVITEPDVTSFYQDRNLVRRISDAAKQVNSRPLLRSIIVNKASEGESKDDNIDLQKLETSFRLELEKEFPVKFLDTYPVPVDMEAFKAYQTQRIPYLAAPASLFAFATLTAYREILQIVTARWSEDQVQKWNVLVEKVSKAIADRNQRVKAERNAQVEKDQQLIALQSENQTLHERTIELKKETERLESRYERELQRTTQLFSQTSPSAARETSGGTAPGSVILPPRSRSSKWKIAVAMLLPLAAAVGSVLWYLRNDRETLLRNAYNESLPISLRVSYVKQLSDGGHKNFDGIKLPGASFAGLQLDHASFRSATLPSASFRRASLPSCDLSGADLSGADLTEAGLGGCLLRNTNLARAELSGADLRGADLTGATVLLDQLKTAETDKKATLSEAASPANPSDKTPVDASLTALAPSGFALQYSLAGHTGEVRGIAFSPDGTLLASAGQDSKVDLWQVSSGQLLKTLSSPEANAVAFSRDGHLLASGGQYASNILLWDTSKWREIGNLSYLSNFGSPVYSLAFTRDGRFLAAAQASGLHLFDVLKLAEVHAPSTPEALASLAMSDDGQLFATASTASSNAYPLILWDTNTWKPYRTLKWVGAYSVAISLTSTCWLAAEKTRQ